MSQESKSEATPSVSQTRLGRFGPPQCPEMPTRLTPLHTHVAYLSGFCHSQWVTAGDTVMVKVQQMPWSFH